MDTKVLGLEVLVLAAAGLSTWWLWSFVEGMLQYQDLWNGSDYVRLLVLGLISAIAAVASGEALRRTDKQYREGLGSLFVFVARAMLAVQLLALLYCNVGPFRGAIYTGARVLTTYGMARDLPEPPSP